MEKTLNSEIQRIKSAKTDIKNALIAKEVAVPEDASLDTFAELINNIKGGTSSAEVSAKRADVLAGTTTITADSNDEIVEGTMVNHGAVSQTLNCGGTFSIPAGYHNGSGIITAADLASQTPGTATASRIYSGNTAWVNGIQVIGTMAVTSAINFKAATLSASSIRISWTNPSKGPYSGVKIRYSTSGYPGVSGGTLAYTGVGSNSSAGGSSYVDITGLSIGTTYYFTCVSYCTGLGDSATGYNVSAKSSGFLLYDEGYNAVNLVAENSEYVTFGSSYITVGHALYTNLYTATSIPLKSYDYLVVDATPTKFNKASYDHVGFDIRTNERTDYQYYFFDPVTLNTRRTFKMAKSSKWTYNSIGTHIGAASGMDHRGAHQMGAITIKIHKIYLI